MKLLIENYCDVNVRSSKGSTGLFFTAYNGHYECLKLLGHVESFRRF
jgi:ankyrin repeat protein